MLQFSVPFSDRKVPQDGMLQPNELMEMCQSHWDKERCNCWEQCVDAISPAEPCCLPRGPFYHLVPAITTPGICSGSYSSSQAQIYSPGWIIPFPLSLTSHLTKTSAGSRAAVQQHLPDRCTQGCAWGTGWVHIQEWETEQKPTCPTVCVWLELGKANLFSFCRVHVGKVAL